MTQEIDIEKYHQLALQKQKEHRKVLANLKKKPPKNLDKIAQEIHDESFPRNRLYACANCCKTLGPDFKGSGYHADRQIFQDEASCL